MVFWMAVLVGAFFAWVAVQAGFYATWMLMVNLLLSAYLALYLSPVIIENVPAATGTPYGYTLVFLFVAAATMILAYAICYAFLSGQLRFEFPKILDTIGAGIVGFLAGFLGWSVFSFSFALLPLWELDTLRSLGFEASSQRANTKYMCWCCDLLHTLTYSSESESTSEEAADRLLRMTQPLDESESEDTTSGAKEATKAGPSNASKTGASGAQGAETGNRPTGYGGRQKRAESTPPAQAPPPGTTP